MTTRFELIHMRRMCESEYNRCEYVMLEHTNAFEQIIKLGTHETGQDEKNEKESKGKKKERKKRKNSHSKCGTCRSIRLGYLYCRVIAFAIILFYTSCLYLCVCAFFSLSCFWIWFLVFHFVKLNATNANCSIWNAVR